MRRFVAIGVLAMVLSTQSLAHETTTVRLSKPTTDDVAAARLVTDAFVETLVGDSVETAIRQIADSSKLFSEKQQEINLIIAQAKNAELLYGEVKKCSPSEYRYNSNLRIEFQYVCQHENLLIEWTLKVDHLPKGWAISNFSFRDSF